MANSMIWTEKYRPSTFEEVKGQREIVARAAAFVKQKNMPHLLFAGPAGTGKSSLAIVIAKQLFGDSWKSNYLEMNASDERGIDIVRNKVKNFARTKSIGKVPFKILFLDESDALTREAQQALRRTMEMFTNTCRFILSCNYSSKIIDPIQSRCSIFRFKLLSKDEIKEIINNISNKEKLEIDDKAIDALYKVTGGDCRRLINILQATSSVNKKITDKLIYEIVAEANPKEIGKVLNYALQGNFLEARNLLLDIMLKNGLSGLDVIKAIQKEIWALPIDDKLKVVLTEKIGETEFRIVEGSDEFLQLEALLASFTLAKKT
ncbi:Replication factor C small subunit [Candidatus Pacearchaeota archaeon ex4484_26]|nr:MAG: Replication factor C small subunit [Candidatus Pacearchaeota archaeon ex4484_26]